MVIKSNWDPFYVPVVKEGGVANPDTFTFDCDCEECQKKYDEWKEAYLEEQGLTKKGEQP